MLFFKACTVLTALFAAAVNAQEVTTTDAFGNTIVDTLSFDPLQEITVTIPIETIAAAVSTATTTTTTTAAATTSTITTSTTTSTSATLAVDPGQQGPVGQPAGTTAAPGGPTPFTYTTTDADGNTIQVEATFTPVFSPTQQPTPATTGTILDYSDWLGLVGTQTAAFGGSGSTVANGASSQWQGAIARVFAITAGVIGGAMLVV